MIEKREWGFWTVINNVVDIKEYYNKKVSNFKNIFATFKIEKGGIKKFKVSRHPNKDYCNFVRVNFTYKKWQNIIIDIGLLPEDKKIYIFYDFDDNKDKSDFCRDFLQDFINDFAEYLYK